MNRLYFDDFELDPQSQELRKNGRRVRLPMQALRLLEFLASHPGELITRDQIQRHLWSEDTFVDFEHGINKSIRQIRGALEDDAGSPRFIETLPRRGYRFIRQSRFASGPAGTDIAGTTGGFRLSNPPKSPEEDQDTRLAGLARRSKYLIWGVSALAVVLVISLVYQGFGRSLASSMRGPIRSIAVLPLNNLSGDPSQDYFADGVTEEITTYLAQVAPLRVISHTSVVQYKGTRKSLAAIGRELGVDAVVEGGVLRSGDRVRITAQLIRAAADEHLWAESYEREAKDILGLQEDLARDISAEIKIKLAALDHRVRIRQIPLEAHDDYLKGRYEWNTRSPASLRRSVEFFQQAVLKDPDYAAAYAGLANSYEIMGVAGYDGLPISEAMSKAKAAASKAIHIDDTLSEAHSALAFVEHTYDWDWQATEREFKRALALNPSNATAHQWYSEYLCNQSRWSESIAEAEAALAIDPNSLIIKENLARPYYYSRQFDKAIEYSRETQALDPSFAISHLRLGRAYAAKGMYAEASSEFRRFSDLVGGSTLATASLANISARAGDKKSALHLAAELRKMAAMQPVPAYQFAIVYAGLGNTEEAINWLEEAYRERNDFLLVVKNESIFDGLRNDQRFQDIERRIGLAP